MSFAVIIVDEIPFDNRILEFVVMDNVSHGQGKEKDEKEEKCYTLLNHQESENNENGKKHKKHDQQMGKSFVLKEPNLGEMIGGKSLIKWFFF
jgi:hypothetical protein